tara:strand:- start:1218 stop:3053 length:1836 start_codon:yes stop_codon:yes gene_type:complete
MPKRKVDDYYNNIGISSEHYDDDDDLDEYGHNVNEDESSIWDLFKDNVPKSKEGIDKSQPFIPTRASDCPFNPDGRNHEFIKDQNSDVTCKHCGEEVTDYEVKLWGESYSTEEFKEDDHPRDGDGQFASKGGGSTKDSKPKGKRIVGVTQYGEEDSERLGKMYQEFPTDKTFTGSKGHLINAKYGSDKIIVGGKVNKANGKVNSLISKYQKLKTDDNDKPLNYSKGSALLKEMEEYENKAFEELQKLNKNRDLVKDGLWVIAGDQLQLEKGSKDYPLKDTAGGYGESEFRKFDFESGSYGSQKQMVKTGDKVKYTIEYDMGTWKGNRGGWVGRKTSEVELLVTGFSYGEEDHDPITVDGIIQSSGKQRYIGDNRKGTRGYTQIDNSMRLVKDGGVKMVGESKATELSPEAQCPKCGSYKTILEGKSSLGYGKRRQYTCLNCYNVFQSEHSPKEIRAMYGDHTSPYDRNRWGESVSDVDLKCGMCNGTGEIYLDSIVTCHECGGTGKITFDQLPQWKKDQSTESKYTIDDDFDESDQNDGEIQEKYVRGYENDWEDKLDTWDGRAVSDNFTTVQPYDPVNPKYECIYCNKEFSWDDTFTHDGSHETFRYNRI